MTDHHRQSAYRWDRRGQDFDAQARIARTPERAAELREHAAMCFARADACRRRSNEAQRQRERRKAGVAAG